MSDVTSENKEKKVKKIVPSKLENAAYGIVYNSFGKLIPEKMTPNQMTLIGALGGLIGIIFAFLSRINSLFLIGTICGILTHFIADDLDGFIARKKKMTSTAGAFFDLLTDILHITYLLIALCFSGFISFEVAIFLVPVYALLMFTAMNYIRYLDEFLFPRVGPIETHLLFIVLCILGMVFKTEPVFTLGSLQFKIADILLVAGGSVMYFEMIRLQIQLFVRLKEKDNDNR